MLTSLQRSASLRNQKQAKTTRKWDASVHGVTKQYELIIKYSFNEREDELPDVWPYGYC